ncbi:MAG: hypothetical protein ACLRWM_09410 [Streptococcus sp.]
MAIFAKSNVLKRLEKCVLFGDVNIVEPVILVSNRIKSIMFYSVYFNTTCIYDCGYLLMVTGVVNIHMLSVMTIQVNCGIYFRWVSLGIMIVIMLVIMYNLLPIFWGDNRALKQKKNNQKKHLKKTKSRNEENYEQRKR